MIRGSEYLSSTPKYNLLYQAFGWEIPTYTHCPPVMKDAQNKLSKRNGDASYQAVSYTHLDLSGIAEKYAGFLPASFRASIVAAGERSIGAVLADNAVVLALSLIHIYAGPPGP